MALNISQLAGPGGSGANPANPATTVAQEPVTGDQNSLTQFMRSMENLMSTQGQGQFNAGTQGAGVALGQLQKLAGGNEAAVNEATQSEQDQITEGFNRARQMISTMPRGGGTASAQVQAPDKAIKDIAELKSQAKTAATGELGQLGTQLAGLGLEGERDAAVNALTTRAQDIQGGTANTFSSIVTAIGSLI